MRALLIGLAVGVGAGMLFAPASGKESRRAIAERANQLGQSVRTGYRRIRGKASRKIAEVREEAERFADV